MTCVRNFFSEVSDFFIVEVRVRGSFFWDVMVSEYLPDGFSLTYKLLLAKPDLSSRVSAVEHGYVLSLGIVDEGVEAAVVVSCVVADAEVEPVMDAGLEITSLLSGYLLTSEL